MRSCSVDVPISSASPPLPSKFPPMAGKGSFYGHRLGACNLDVACPVLSASRYNVSRKSMDRWDDPLQHSIETTCGLRRKLTDQGPEFPLDGAPRKIWFSICRCGIWIATSNSRDLLRITAVAFRPYAIGNKRYTLFGGKGIATCGTWQAICS